ncbi:hypothetical protein GOP47_0022374 [Adiantum capillus-veneris]|uniref:Origin recognition complex subunit 6 n=1 Tax=Adiantum capillus-veneris TaxID=13818 RepID=A0A9D4U5Q0_ADICA|nr:hypothetical protein GOP47_0022374 [Adiantum capillus-veneris]
MDLTNLEGKLGLAGCPAAIRKAKELQRLSKLQFDSSAFGLGEVCKAVLCFELACSLLHVDMDRQKAIRISGLSEKAYIRSLTNLQNALGLRPALDVRELAVQFGCVRLVGSVQRVLTEFKQRFVAALPASRKGNADFSRPVFTAVAFYLCAKKHKLKVDKMRLIESCGTSESEFATVSTSMLDLCFDMVGIQKEKKNSKSVKCNRDLLDALPSKRRLEDEHSDSDSDPSDEDAPEVPGMNLSKKKAKASYEAWKASVVTARDTSKPGPDTNKRTRQATLNFLKTPSTPACA